MALSDMIRDFKAGSSGWMHDVFPDLEDFNWQKGYGAFTVGASQIEQVRRYIANQAVHHQKQTFEEEFISMLDACGIEYDLKYLFKG
jgi:REP element-mobilizing transposase RayT